MNVEMSASPTQQPAPIAKPDMRPTADAAAIAHDPRPEIPMPMPASTTQAGQVNESKVAAKTEVEAVERILKPYGVDMLPNREGSKDLPANAEKDSDDSPDEMT